MTVLPRIPSFRLEGRWALVTGGSKGLGLAAAAALVQSGAHVTIAARSATTGCSSTTATALKASSSACWMAGSVGVAGPSNSRSVTTRCAAESSCRFSSLARGTQQSCCKSVFVYRLVPPVGAVEAH